MPKLPMDNGNVQEGPISVNEADSILGPLEGPLLYFACCSVSKLFEDHFSHF